jgi:hypothetical protein
MSGNWLELGLTKDEETIVRRAAQIYKTVYLDTIDNVFEVARALKILQDRHQMLGVRGTLADALVQFGFTARDGGAMNKALISHHKQLLLPPRKNSFSASLPANDIMQRASTARSRCCDRSHEANNSHRLRP